MTTTADVPRESACPACGSTTTKHEHLPRVPMSGHPNVVAVLDQGRTDDGLVFLVMEFVDAQNLQEIIAERGRLDSVFLADVVGLSAVR